MNRDQQIIWAAGFLDGEGSFIIAYDCNGVFSPRLNAGQACKEPLELLEEVFGGSITSDDKARSSRFSTKTIYQWYLTGPKLFVALQELYPYLIVKQDQCGCLLSLFESINNYKGKVGRNREFEELPEDVRLYRAALYLRCKDLKHGSAATTEREGSS